MGSHRASRTGGNELIYRAKERLAGLFLSVCLLLITTSGLRADVKPAYVHFIDVGKADATLIEFPCATMLIDAGLAKDGPNKLMPYLKTFFARRPHLNNTIDLVVLTHGDRDHTRNIGAVVDSYRVKRLLWNGVADGDQRSLPALLAKHSDIRRFIVGMDDPQSAYWPAAEIDPIDCGDVDPKITALWGHLRLKPDAWKQRHYKKRNNHSIALRVDYGRGSMLFPGDLLKPALRDVLKSPNADLVDVDLYKVSHHGFRDADARRFVKRVSPNISVISRGSVRPLNVKVYRTLERFTRDFRRKPLRIKTWRFHKGKKTADYPRSDEAGNKLIWGVDKGVAGRGKFEKAVYWTGLEGTIVVRVEASGRMAVIAP